MRRLSGGQAEQADFRCSVEAEPEQKPERVSVPTAPDQRKERAQQARDRAALRKAVIVIFGRHPAGLSDGAQYAADLRQHHDIGRRDREQERRGDCRGNHAADLLQGGEVLLRGGGHWRDCENESDDDCCVAEREEESDGDRAPPFLHQLAGDVVDRRDMVGVEGMPQPEAVGEEGRAKKKRIALKRRERPQPDGDVGGDEDRIEPTTLPRVRSGASSKMCGNMLRSGTRGVRACSRKSRPWT
jgi:hypothetical protein